MYISLKNVHTCSFSEGCIVSVVIKIALEIFFSFLILKMIDLGVFDRPITTCSLSTFCPPITT